MDKRFENHTEEKQMRVVEVTLPDGNKFLSEEHNPAQALDAARKHMGENIKDGDLNKVKIKEHIMSEEEYCAIEGSFEATKFWEDV